MTLVHDAQLFGKYLKLVCLIGKLGVGFVKLFLHKDQLIPQRRSKDDKSIFVKII